MTSGVADVLSLLPKAPHIVQADRGVQKRERRGVAKGDPLQDLSPKLHRIGFPQIHQFGPDRLQLFGPYFPNRGPSKDRPNATSDERSRGIRRGSSRQRLRWNPSWEGCLLLRLGGCWSSGSH